MRNNAGVDSPHPVKDAADIPELSDQEAPENVVSLLDSSKDAAPMVKIGERQFRIDELKLLEAEEHYLKVTSACGVFLVREKISVACADIPDELGMRVHRSLWVAHAEAQSVVNLAPGRYGIQTRTLGVVSLSRGLKDEFRRRHEDWCKENLV